MKEEKESEQRIDIGSRFHSLGAGTGNAREPMTVQHRGSTKRPITEDRRLREGMYGETSG